MTRRLLLAVALLGLAVGQAQASINLGSFAIGDDNTTVDTGSVQTATTITFTDLASTGSLQGIFSAIPPLDFGSFTFTIATPSTFVLSDIADGFGTFTGSVVTPLSSGPEQASWAIDGTWVAGTGAWLPAGYSGKSFDADVTLGLTQSGGSGNAISSSGTFAVPNPVPEPATMVGGLIGFGLLGLGYVVRRRSA